MAAGVVSGFAGQRRSGQQMHRSTASMILSYQVPTVPCCIHWWPGRTAEIRLAMDLTIFDVALRSLGHPFRFEVDLGKSKSHGNIQLRSTKITA